jgi:hypothetical protein
VGLREKGKKRRRKNYKDKIKETKGNTKGEGPKEKIEKRR